MTLPPFPHEREVETASLRGLSEPILHLCHRRFDGPEVPPALLAELPQRTSLERAVVGHLRDGGHWYNQTGWFRRLP